jgi:hypothetical protein
MQECQSINKHDAQKERVAGKYTSPLNFPIDVKAERMTLKDVIQFCVQSAEDNDAAAERLSSVINASMRRIKELPQTISFYTAALDARKNEAKKFRKCAKWLNELIRLRSLPQITFCKDCGISTPVDAPADKRICPVYCDAVDDYHFCGYGISGERLNGIEAKNAAGRKDALQRKRAVVDVHDLTKDPKDMPEEYEICPIPREEGKAAHKEAPEMCSDVVLVSVSTKSGEPFTTCARTYNGEWDFVYPLDGDDDISVTAWAAMPSLV